MNNVYVWYSEATDITGKKLMEEFKCKGGTTAPTDPAIDTVLCWGTKTTKAVKFGNGIKKVFNHPDSIRKNRDKVSALSELSKADCNVAKFSTNFDNSGLSFPMIARTSFHQGGKGFWLCLNKEHVRLAKNEGAKYLQEFINNKDEYRLHIVKGKMIYAAKKTVRDNMQEAYIEQHADKIKNWAEKNNVNIDNDTMINVLKRVARAEAEKANHIVKSNSKGWKFVKVDNPPANLVTQACLALEALKLDYGAVDCCIDLDNKPWVLEVNSGPGLESTTFTTWATTLKALIVPEKKAAPKNKPPVNAADPVNIVANKADKGAKASLKNKLSMMSQLVEAANEEEAAVLEKLWEKIAG